MFWFLVVFVLVWLFGPPDQRMRLLLAIMTAALAAEFSICMLDGADGGRHLTLFNALLDFLVCCDAVLAARRWLLTPEAISDTAHSPS